MSAQVNWLADFSIGDELTAVDGLVPVEGYIKTGQPVEEVAVMEKAKYFGADAVFFEAARHGKSAVAQAFIYRSDGPDDSPEFAKLHRRLWSWGGVPLVYRCMPGLIQLFRCAHKPDFDVNGQLQCKPIKTLDLAIRVTNAPWWNEERLRTGSLWDDPNVCKEFLSADNAAQKTLIAEVKSLYVRLNNEKILPEPLRRRLLILSVLIAYLENREVLGKDFFAGFKPGATKFFEVLADGPALADMLEHLEQRFNGNVFILSKDDRDLLRNNTVNLEYYARLVEGREEPCGQRTLWRRYSFADLPVELISHIYQLFVKDTSTAIYTPHFFVQLILGEILSPQRMDRLENNDEVILDPACGSGIFLVEAYKRLVLHWRSKHEWKRPSQNILKKLITTRLLGFDLDEGAVELAAFSLCLALCDALEPEEIRKSVKLFPVIMGNIIHSGCFFKALHDQTIKERVGVIVGNPPFTSKLGTPGAQLSYELYQQTHGLLPDKQIAYLFLHESMNTLEPGGMLAMIQQYNLLYNQKPIGFRQTFLMRWHVHEILDFISIRGLFKMGGVAADIKKTSDKGGSDTKVVVVVAEACAPKWDKPILHATFRRSGRVVARQGFDIDYYDMHWLPRRLPLQHDRVWRSDLLGGGRVLEFANRLSAYRTLGQYADDLGWDYGEGFIAAKTGKRKPADHLTGKALLPSSAITTNGIDEKAITEVTDVTFRSAYTPLRYSPPMLLIREHMNLYHDIWTKDYLAYKQGVFGFCAPNRRDVNKLQDIAAWLKSENITLKAFAAVISVRLFTQRATAITWVDIENLPYPPDRDLDLSTHEEIIAADIVEYYRDFVRCGQESKSMKEVMVDDQALISFNNVFRDRINAVYKNNPLRVLKAHSWPGFICQPFIFGNGEIDWNGGAQLKNKLDVLLKEKLDSGLNITRIARIYDGPFIYMLKPDRLRYWLRSIALRDSDETLADLADQGF